MEDQATESDHIVRAMTDDGSFRIVTVRSTKTVSGVLDMQQVGGSTARHLADLTTGAILVRETMSPSLRVQGILKRPGRSGYLLADSHPSGRARGLASIEKERDCFELDHAILKMVRSLHNGRIQQGVVAVPEESDVSHALMTYMQESEQITTMIVVSALLSDATEQCAEPPETSEHHEDGERRRVLAAGGYVLQLLPNARQDLLAIMTERLEDFRNIDGFLRRDDFSPRLLITELLYGIDHTLLEDTPIRPGCWCSHASMMGALSTLHRSEIQEMVDDGEVLEIQCDYCRREYRVSPAQLRGLLDDN